MIPNRFKRCKPGLDIQAAFRTCQGPRRPTSDLFFLQMRFWDGIVSEESISARVPTKDQLAFTLFLGTTPLLDEEPKVELPPRCLFLHWHIEALSEEPLPAPPPWAPRGIQLRNEGNKGNMERYTTCDMT